jgi:hypothetical protein
LDLRNVVKEFFDGYLVEYCARNKCNDSRNLRSYQVDFIDLVSAKCHVVKEYKYSTSAAVTQHISRGPA